MRPRGWINFDTDQGGVLWGCLCCWLGVLSNFGMLSLGVPIFYIVPWSLFGVPIVVTLLVWAAQRQIGK